MRPLALELYWVTLTGTREGTVVPPLRSTLSVHTAIAGLEAGPREEFPGSREDWTPSAPPIREVLQDYLRAISHPRQVVAKQPMTTVVTNPTSPLLQGCFYLKLHLIPADLPCLSLWLFLSEFASGLSPWATGSPAPLTPIFIGAFGSVQDRLARIFTLRVG